MCQTLVAHMSPMYCACKIYLRRWMRWMRYLLGLELLLGVGVQQLCGWDAESVASPCLPHE